MNLIIGILVRDQAAENKLRAEIGNIGSIMWVSLYWLWCNFVAHNARRTLYDSKGLEFDDVILTTPWYPDYLLIVNINTGPSVQLFSRLDSRCLTVAGGPQCLKFT
jgi:hypothetical protein